MKKQITTPLIICILAAIVTIFSVLNITTKPKGSPFGNISKSNIISAGISDSNTSDKIEFSERAIAIIKAYLSSVKANKIKNKKQKKL